MLIVFINLGGKMRIKEIKLIDFPENEKKILIKILENNADLFCCTSLKTKKQLENYIRNVNVQ